MVEVTLESLPAGVREGTIQAWFLEEGDAVVAGDDLVELATEEGPITLSAPVSGILAEVYYDEGETVERGEILCLIEDEEGSDDEDDEDEKKGLDEQEKDK